MEVTLLIALVRQLVQLVQQLRLVGVVGVLVAADRVLVAGTRKVEVGIVNTADVPRDFFERQVNLLLIADQIFA